MPAEHTKLTQSEEDVERWEEVGTETGTADPTRIGAGAAAGALLGRRRPAAAAAAAAAALLALALLGAAVVASGGQATESSLPAGPAVEALLSLREQILPSEMPCGGPCRDDLYTCIEKADGSYSQCIDCNAEGNYQYDCASYDNELRAAAVKACGMPCDNNPPIPPCQLDNRLETDFSVKECREEQDRSVRVQCKAPNAKHCGTRLSSHGQTGVGIYSINMQAAYGPGVATNFYLDTHGRARSKKMPFNEIKFEVLGSQCGDGESKIMTAFALPNLDASKPGKNMSQHRRYHHVKFDACDDWHKYEFIVLKNSIKWKVDGKVLREEDFSKSPEMLVDIHKGRLETHAAVWGQDENAEINEEMGYLVDNKEDFPLYAWFANVKMPKTDKDDAPAYQWVYNPASN